MYTGFVTDAQLAKSTAGQPALVIELERSLWAAHIALAKQLANVTRCKHTFQQ